MQRGGPSRSPAVPPRPSADELNNPIRHSRSKQAEPDVAQKSGVSGVMQKVNPFSRSSAKPAKVGPEDPVERTVSDSKQSAGGFRGVMQKVNPFRSTAQNVSSDCLSEKNNTEAERVGYDHAEKPAGNKQSAGGFRGVMQKVNPFRSTAQPVSSDLSTSRDRFADNSSKVDQGGNDYADEPAGDKQSAGGFRGVMQKVNPFRSTAQAEGSGFSASKDCPSDNSNAEVSIGREHEDCPMTEQPVREKKGVTFRIRRILPGALFGSTGKESAQEAGGESKSVALQGSTVEIQDLQVAPLSSDGEVADSEEEDSLMAWWRTVQGWSQWNESPEFQEDEQMAAEQAADRVYMAARLFVHLFNLRGGSLQQRILELLALADAADNFHKRTVTASVGGGVASVAGSVTTITGLILAPFTFGTSIIVTAVGIGVATAGGLTSASANITDTVHSNTDRKKVEKMIEEYQEEMKDIKECLEFVQEGMNSLELWNFEHYKETVSKRAMNQNVKHALKEGGRAGKALMINTENLISTVQVFSVAGGAAKAAQAISVTTGVMSGLFLALDLFFLAKDSHELRKGAKTQFATKIREVCKDLQEGLLELNRIKTDLQKTMDGFELEEDEEEDEEEEEEEAALTSDPGDLIQLE